MRETRMWTGGNLEKQTNQLKKKLTFEKVLCGHISLKMLQTLFHLPFGNVICTAN